MSTSSLIGQSWPCPAASGTTPEYALVAGGIAPQRLLIIPALFDESNRMRRFTVEVMRRLSAAQISSILPDLPGTNESLAPLDQQTPASWRAAMLTAASHFGATHVLAIRGGALLAPPALTGWRYAPALAHSQLRAMLRARILADREMGREETQESLLKTGANQGLELVGYRLSPAFLAAFQTLESEESQQSIIGQDMLSGPGLWLRAEPGENADQADALAAIIALGIAA